MRIRYWRLGISEVLKARYPVDKVNHWEIKCMLGEYQHFGVFWYKYGTPFDKELISGICFYYNEIPDTTVQEIVQLLHDKFGGDILYRQTRVFLRGSREFAASDQVGMLANQLSLKFNSPVEISIEFEKITEEEKQQNSLSLPTTKALPIVGPD
ncbi:MAG: hypothetical protein WBP64_06485 [Nitrososphaeraceae archaeon]